MIFLLLAKIINSTFSWCIGGGGAELCVSCKFNSHEIIRKFYKANDNFLFFKRHGVLPEIKNWMNRKDYFYILGHII